MVNAGTATFNVSWNKNAMPAAIWSDTVWVFVDYNNNGVMTRLPLLPGATLTATSPGGKVIEETGNNKGVWVAGNARSAGSFSATVKLLTATADLNGLCAYAINYQPVGEYISGTEISFTGTPPYDLVFKSGGTLTINAGSFVLTEALQSFTDMTGAPCSFTCIPPAAPTNPSANSRCGSGAVTFSATVPSSITIDWYDASSGGSVVSGGSGVTSFSPTLTQTTTYYAKARNTNTPGCVSSSRLGVTGTVRAYGSAGSAPGQCGCGTGLTNCSGTCKSSCSAFTACSGFTMVTDLIFEQGKALAWYKAKATCTDKGSGWTLPNASQLACLYDNRSKLPGGYSNGTYWSSTERICILPCRYAKSFYDGSEGGQLIDNEYYVKCVK
jgi:hypothetical protein